MNGVFHPWKPPRRSTWIPTSFEVVVGLDASRRGWAPQDWPPVETWGIHGRKKHIFLGLQLDETDKGSWKKYKIHEIHFKKCIYILYVSYEDYGLFGWLVGCLCLCPICTCAAFCKISSTTAESNLRLDTLVTCRA